MCSRAHAIKCPTWDLNNRFRQPFYFFSGLCFISSAFYLLYCSDAEVLFIITCGRHLEQRDKQAQRARLSRDAL